MLCSRSTVILCACVGWTKGAGSNAFETGGLGEAGRKDSPAPKDTPCRTSRGVVKDLDGEEDVDNATVDSTDFYSRWCILLELRSAPLPQDDLEGPFWDKDKRERCKHCTIKSSRQSSSTIPPHPSIPRSLLEDSFPRQKQNIQTPRTSNQGSPKWLDLHLSL